MLLKCFFENRFTLAGIRLFEHHPWRKKNEQHSSNSNQFWTAFMEKGDSAKHISWETGNTSVQQQHFYLASSTQVNLIPLLVACVYLLQWLNLPDFSLPTSSFYLWITYPRWHEKIEQLGTQVWENFLSQAVSIKDNPSP